MQDCQRHYRGNQRGGTPDEVPRLREVYSTQQHQGKMTAFVNAAHVPVYSGKPTDYDEWSVEFTAAA